MSSDKVFEEMVKYQVIDVNDIKNKSDLRKYLKDNQKRKDGAIVIPFPEKLADAFVNKSPLARETIIKNSGLHFESITRTYHNKNITYMRKGKRISYTRTFHMIRGRFISKSEYQEKRFLGVWRDSEGNKQPNPLRY